jgi:hypothetical protein
MSGMKLDQQTGTTAAATAMFPAAASRGPHPAPHGDTFASFQVLTLLL